MSQKVAYVCGPLTGLGNNLASQTKRFYERIGDACQEVLGVRAFVPHEHFDPLKHSNFTPQQVDESERDQVCNKTSVLIVVPIADSWGGGIELEMANQSGVPAIIICDTEKLQARKISRLLRGNPAVKMIIGYSSEDEAVQYLKASLKLLVKNKEVVLQ